MKGFEALARAIVAEGVDTVFGVLGGGILDLARVLRDEHGVRFVAARHEDVAVGMADGYARSSGRVGVALLCLGPGLANGLAAMIAARMTSSRLLVVVGGMPDVDPQNNMSIDQRSLLSATIERWEELARPARLADQVAHGFARVRAGVGPLALHFCNADADFPADWAYSSIPIPPPGPVLRPRPEDVAALTERLANAKRPVLLAGAGAVAAKAREAILVLAEKAGALLTTSLLARCYFAGNPFDIGLSGGFSTEDTIDVASECDLVVTFGASFNQHTSAYGTLFRNAELVQIDCDPNGFCKYQLPDMMILADARAMAEDLVTALPAQQRPGWRDEAMASRIAAFDRWRGRDLTERRGLVNPRKLVDIIEANAPADRILITDIGLFIGVPAANLPVPDPGSMMVTWQLGRIGSALPLALGAAIARPDRLVTAFIGDGGFMASIHALETMATLGVPILVFVMDDNGLGAERRIFALQGVSSTIADHSTPDIAAIARTLGINAHRIDTLDQATVLLSCSQNRRRATLLQVAIDPEIDTVEIDRGFYAKPGH